MSAHLDFKHGPPTRVWCRGGWNRVVEGACSSCGVDVSHRLTKAMLTVQDAVVGSARRRYTPTPAPHVPPQAVRKGGLVVEEDS